MKKLRAAGLIHGSQIHHLDHIAPLCLIMQIPLIVTELPIRQLAKKYYPPLRVLCYDYLKIGIKVTEMYDVLFSSLPTDLLEQIFFFAQTLLKKKLIYIWCPHGISDKGVRSYFMEGLRREKIALLPGQKIVDSLIEKSAYLQLYATISPGNLRYRFYRKQAAFYENLLKKELFSHLVQGNFTILYAPTWEDAENSSSLFDALPTMLETLPRQWNLIVKPHPNTLLEPHKLEPLFALGAEKPNILFLTDFPPIYPLLRSIDVYIGDRSSIGYDCLAFDKPLFLLNQTMRGEKGSHLLQCGYPIAPDHYCRIFSILEMELPKDQNRFQKRRREVYAYAFGREKPEQMLRFEIEEAYERYAAEAPLTL